jgi:hypothetical protein
LKPALLTVALTLLLGVALGALPGVASSPDASPLEVAHSAGAGAVAAAAPEAQGGRIQGYAMGFFRTGQAPGGPCPSIAQIDEDLRHIDQGHLANAIRF